MTTHMSVRLAWHDSGWNGHICNNPEANTYCVGAQSYPGDKIVLHRALDWESKQHGKHCGALTDRIPPCCYSNNAFGLQSTPADADPPTWLGKSASLVKWTMPPATACVWPYEEMFNDEVKSNGKWDYDKRMEKAKQYFSEIEPNKSLIVYYANYSNPFSEEESKRYVLVGISRVKKVGSVIYYEDCTEEVKARYAGGFVWQLPITSHYPDEGFCIPYHKYQEQPEVLERIAIFPENPRLFKYATRHMSDDDALGVVEGFLQVVKELQEMGDTTEDWSVRKKWLESLVSELWAHRGLLPGTPAALEYLSFQAAIPFFKEKVLVGEEVEAHNSIFSLLDGKISTIENLPLKNEDIKAVQRRWRLQETDEKQLIRDVLPRYSFKIEQLAKIMNESRSNNGISVSLKSIAENPYVLSEQYIGDNPDDRIPWGLIDRGMIPSPELGGSNRIETDDPRRFRGLIVDMLKRDSTHVFIPTDSILDAVNRRLSVFPEWKRFSFTKGYFRADEDFIGEAVVQRRLSDTDYLYLKDCYDAERYIEEKLRFVLGGADIRLRTPVTEEIWNGYLYNPQSPLALKAPEEYRNAIDKQIQACQRIFVRPISVLAGEAGTGKTTVIRAIVKAIKRAHGSDAFVVALAPTGKAADRIRDFVEEDPVLKGQVEIVTIHSFLAKRGWLNPNMSFKHSGGMVEEDFTTYIIDESSMLELELTATLFRAINWQTVHRLILVGDPNQLPPIGRGRLFADIIDFMHESAPESIAVLEDNLRQLLGKVTTGATGIIDLAKCFLYKDSSGPKNEEITTEVEIMMQKVQEGGDIAPDLRVIYWKNQEELEKLLFRQMSLDLEADLDSAEDVDTENLNELWRAVQEKSNTPTFFQILSPYRGDQFGVDEINRVSQERLRGKRPSHENAIDGIMLFDKVIQVRNRPKSNPIWAHNHSINRREQIEIFNGQLGFVWPHLFDGQKWKYYNFQLKRFRVAFDRRENYSVGYGSGLGKDNNNKFLPSENVQEDLELAYAISVHKAQGSDFNRVYVFIPKNKKSLLTTEMFYTALTRAQKHCTIFVEEDLLPLIGMRRLEASKLRRINSSLFISHIVPEELLEVNGWYEDGRIHRTLADVVVRSKSEVIIANILSDRDIPFYYERPLYAPDGTFHLPDFTIKWRGEEYYWEHVGMLERDDYKAHWEKKKKWYDKFFHDRLLITEESGELSIQANEIIKTHLI